MAADLEAVFMPAGSMAAVFTVTGSVAVDLEGFGVDLACWDGPTMRIHTGGIIIRTTVTAEDNTVTHTPGITARILPVITLM